MPVNIDEIKKLSDEEKLKLIDEILESIAEETIDEYLTEANEDNILQERWEKYKSGKTTFNSWENGLKNLKDKAQKRLKKGNDKISD
jgi:putative addiction module component (TIGR02574 family)